MKDITTGVTMHIYKLPKIWFRHFHDPETYAFKMGDDLAIFISPENIAQFKQNLILACLNTEEVIQ